MILIVFGISWFQLKDGERKTRDAQRKADVELVARKLVAYFGDHNIYPAASESGTIAACGLWANERCLWGQGAIKDAEGVTYLSKLPQDPLDRLYVYVPNAERNKFRIYVGLERSQDRDLKHDLTIACGMNVQCNWYVEN